METRRRGREKETDLNRNLSLELLSIWPVDVSDMWVVHGGAMRTRQRS